MQQWIAHTGKNGTRQTLLQHLQGTAKRAGACLADIGLEKAAFLAGLLHDLGKYTMAFQQYLEEGDQSKRGSVIHTFQGCRYLLERSDPKNPTSVYTAELLAFAVGAHHGLFDCIDDAGKSGFRYREKKTNIFYEEALSAFFKEIAPEQINRLFLSACAEVDRFLSRIEAVYDKDDEYYFEVGLLARLLLSAVIEGDRHDTAAFIKQLPESVPYDNLQALWHDRLRFIDEKLAQFPANTPVDKARATISDRCKAFSERPAGIYRLNVPTGGGKTLASLRYALAHAEKYKKKRLIFTSPLLSILEQNAAVIRAFVGDNSLILEHHSNLVQAEQTPEQLDNLELLIQSWDAPIIITTLVQLLNCMFDGRTSSIRRFQALCNSVIVIDEVQTVPTKWLSLFNLTIRFLSEQCGATVILCSATQPYLEQLNHPLLPFPENIVPYDPTIWGAFQRTQIQSLENHKLEELPELIRSFMNQTESLLVVCNRKDEAAFLFDQTKSEEYHSYHLSASMCMQHRRDMVASLKASLGREPVLCISTQVIEAGVDISFQQVLRLTAGMDSVVQSAGRCNRNGECGTRCPVYVVECTDEKLGKLPDIQRGKTATINLLNAFRQTPERFNNDLASDEAIRYYYWKFYSDMAVDERDGPLPKWNTTALDLLSENSTFATKADLGQDHQVLWQAFKTAGQAFSVFDENTVDVLTPYGEGKLLISQLGSARCASDPTYRDSLLKRAPSYTISLYDYQRKQLEANGAVYPICGGTVLALQAENYDAHLGLTSEKADASFLEV